MQTDAAEQVAGGIRRHRDDDKSEDESTRKTRSRGDVLDEEIDGEEDPDDDA